MEGQKRVSTQKKRKIKLPFEEDKFDIGTWVYAHRVALCSTLIVYLILAIAFITAKITLEGEHPSNVLSIDLQELAKLEQERDELQKSVEEMQKEQKFDWKSVQNRTSNENSLNEKLTDDRHTDVDQLLKDAAEFQKEMANNRSAYESGVAEAKAIKEQQNENYSNEQQNELRTDSKVKGNVTVSYSFNDPVRYAQRLTIPAYQCEGGGEVVIEATLSPDGSVASAKVKSGGDDCMQRTAINAATSSRFDINEQAPQKHVGTITYIFIPQ